MPDNRRGLITNVATTGITVTYAGVPGSSSAPPNVGVPQIAPPVLGGTGGGAFSGAVYWPRPAPPGSAQAGQAGDEVIALAEGNSHTTAAVSAPNPSMLPTGPAGGFGIYGKGNPAWFNDPTGANITVGWSSAGTLTFIGAATFDQAVTAPSFGIGGEANAITGIRKFTTTVTTTLSASSLSAGSFTPASLSGLNVTSSSFTSPVYAYTANTTVTSVYVAASSGAPPAVGPHDYAVGSLSTAFTPITSVTYTAPTFSGGSVSSWGTLSIGHGTIITGWACTGVNVGDFLTVNIPALAAHPEILIDAVVTATNTVTVTYINSSSSPVSLSGATINLLVFQAS